MGKARRLSACGQPAPATRRIFAFRNVPKRFHHEVRSFDWKAVAASLQERPSLVTHRDERGRNWLHICCATALDSRDARPSIRTADVLLATGIDLNDHAFTEGHWRATPVWFCVAFGRNLRLAEHLLKLGASQHYSLYAAAYNRDTAAIRLLVRYGADVEESSGRGETPLLGAVGWSHFEAAETMLECGANVNAQNDHGMTAAHLMLKKNSDYEYVELLARYEARFDLPDKQGTTAAEISSLARPLSAYPLPVVRAAGPQSPMFLNKKRMIRDEEAFSCILDGSPRPVVHGGWLSSCVTTGDVQCHPSDRSIRRAEVLFGRTLAACIHPIAAWRYDIRSFRVLLLAGYFTAGFIAVLLAVVLMD